jgi:16S rRNA (cytidine1402-2'-O)-methyltransferase
MFTLYLISTPIGNLEDITFRALRMLREVRLIAAEDTRHTKKLLAHYNIQTPCISYHHHNRSRRLDALLNALNEGDLALVSDAGTPALSDPGVELVQACILAGIPICPLPGPSAPIAALVASGLATDQFLYLGFLPRRSSERQALLSHLISHTATLVCFEAPHRLLASLKDMLMVFGDRQIVIAREMTKLHEEFVRGSISFVQDYFTTHTLCGECTLVVAGATTLDDRGHISFTNTGNADETTNEVAIVQRLVALHDQGHSSSAAARLLAKEIGLPKSVVYQLWLNRQG